MWPNPGYHIVIHEPLLDIDQDDDGCYHCCEKCGFGGIRPDIYHHRKR